LLNLSTKKDNFIFHGHKNNREKWKIFSECQILALPSFSEGQPLVLLEALGCGMPIVSSRVGAIPESIEDGKHGFIIEPGSVDLLSESLEKLIVDSELRKEISKQNKKLYHQRYTQDKFLKTQISWICACAYNKAINYGHRWLI